MLQFLNSNQKNFLKKLELILSVRKLKQQNKSTLVKKILKDDSILFFNIFNSAV